MKKLSQSRSSVAATKDLAPDSSHVLTSKVMRETHYRALLTTALPVWVHLSQKNNNILEEFLQTYLLEHKQLNWALGP